MINLARHYYCVDIDIKGFFDNVDHGKLLKQIWTLGIRDKRLLCIISKILKSEIVGEGIPTKGTPQGGIISPLLSLIVLNELDWWVSNQWETYKPQRMNSKGWLHYAHDYTNLKDGYIVRYADDFKIMCRKYDEAQRWYYATVDFLKTRLKLEVSPEKSKVINMKHNSSNYLGFKIKVVPKGNTRYGFIAKTDMSDKAINKAKVALKARIIDIQKHKEPVYLQNYNSAVRGIQNYYCIATNVYNNLTDVNYALLPTIRIRLQNLSRTIPLSATDTEFHKQAKGIREDSKIVIIGNTPLLPVTAVHHVHPMNFDQSICNYTYKGREKIHENLMRVSPLELRTVSQSRDINENIDFNDNRISAYVAQQGNCYISGIHLNIIEAKCFRKKPLKRGGTNRHGNIAFVCDEVFKALFTRNPTDARTLLKKYKLNEAQWTKFNTIRHNYDLRMV